MLAGQEAERLRIAQELHDQVGQELTAALLLLFPASSPGSPAELRATVGEVAVFGARAASRTCVESGSSSGPRRSMTSVWRARWPCCVTGSH